jgi:beta-glucosidase
MGRPGGWGKEFPVPTTQFPQASGLGQTWDPELIEQAGMAEGKETRFLWESPAYQRGGLVVRAPNADLARDPRWGRTEESFGEDPFHTGSMAAAMTRGLQGRDPKHLQTASLLKHFCANSNENGRGSSSSNFDERLFHEYYSAPFRMAVEAGARCYMAAYNAVNHVPAHVHRMHQEITKAVWGVDGIICTDGGALNLLVSAHKYYPDLEMAAAEIIKAGLNQFLDKFPEALRGAHKKGYISEAQMDDSLAGVFRIMIRLGQLDPADQVSYKKLAGQKEPWDSREHRDLARRITEKSVVLLKNEKQALPLNIKKIKNLAVVGRRANGVLLAGYSGDPP